MVDLTVRTGTKVETIAKDHALLISNYYAVIVRCTRCGKIKDVSLHDDPTQEDMAKGQFLPGVYGLRECTCNLSTPSALAKLLKELESAVSKCRTIDEVQRLLRSLAMQEGHNGGHSGA